jgi:hypothetical protein
MGRLEEEWAAAPLGADLDDLSRTPLGVQQLDPFLPGQTERLLDIHMFAGAERIERHAVMRKIGRGNQYGVQIGICDQIGIDPISARCMSSGTSQSNRAKHPGLVGLAHSTNADGCQRQALTEQLKTAKASPDQANY